MASQARNTTTAVSTTGTMQLDVGFAAHQGGRDNQEDSLGFRYQADGSLLAILSDGMGGHAAGEVASEMAVTVFGEYFPQTTGTALQRLEQALHYTQQHLSQCAQQQSAWQSMGATLVAVTVKTDTLSWVSTGDSLLYRCTTDGVLAQLNTSHTLGERFKRLWQTGSISSQAYESIDNPYVLTSALGLNKLQEVDLNQIPLSIGDTIILASDGVLTLTSAEIAACVQAKLSSQIIAERLMQVVLAKHDEQQDNISLIVIRCLAVKQKRWLKVKFAMSGLMVLGLIAALIFSRYQVIQLHDQLQTVQTSVNELQTVLDHTQQALLEQKAKLALLEYPDKKMPKPKGKP